MDRRTFLKAAGAGGFAFPLARTHKVFRSSWEKIHIGGAGIGGKGWSDIGQPAKLGHQIVALCDLDAGRMNRAKKEYPGAKSYTDWRRMLEQSDIDAVTVSTPDHMHCAIAMAAMALGKHVYVQKPLTHSVFEARQLLKMAQKSGVVTQMGNQHRSNAHMKGAKYLIENGAIGAVREAHVWTDRPIWPQGMDRPSGQDEIPSNFDWDLWLGVAPERAFKKSVYHPFKWRGFWDFGTGALGDMGCHLIDPVFFALNLGAPTRVAAQGPEPHPDTAPTWSIVTYDFPARGDQPPVKMTWYDGKKQPSDEVLGFPKGVKRESNGALFVGETGKIFVREGKGPWVIRDDTFADVKVTKVEATNHHDDWCQAILGNGSAISSFDSAVPLTEAVLLGNVAYRMGKAIDWDPMTLRCPNAPEADAFIRREYRDGWDVDWL